MTHKRFARAGLLACAGSLLALAAYADAIVVFGDSQGAQTVQRQVVLAVLEKNPVAVFRVGDQVNDGSSPEQWMAFNRINAELLKTVPYYPALGNHEGGSSLYFENFPQLQNQRWYAVDEQGVNCIVLDSNSDISKGSQQYTWLVDHLQRVSGDARYIIVLMHHPVYSVGLHGDNEKMMEDVLLPLFEKYGVSAVFSGHDHDYQRLFAKGIYFIVTGGGGSELRDKVRESAYLQTFKMAYHFCVLTPGKDALHVAVYGLDLDCIDQFDIPVRVRQVEGS